MHVHGLLWCGTTGEKYTLQFRIIIILIITVMEVCLLLYRNTFLQSATHLFFGLRVDNIIGTILNVTSIFFAILIFCFSILPMYENKQKYSVNKD